MIHTELPLSFPWYNNILKQNRYRRNCVSVKPYKLLSPNNALLPFQFYRDNAVSLEAVDEWKIYDLDGNMVKDLNSYINRIGNTLIDGKQYTWYNGHPIVLSLACGFYYSKIKVSGVTQPFYSEVFYLSNFAYDAFTDYLCIAYGHTCNLGPIKYLSMDIGVDGDNRSFRNLIYLDAFLTHTDPAYLEEVEKDGFNNDIVTFSKFNNRYITQVIVPDYLKTALIMLQLHKSVALTTASGLNVLPINRVLVKTSALEESFGCESQVDLTFEDNC
jgi:hypothetical protein